MKYINHEPIFTEISEIHNILQQKLYIWELDLLNFIGMCKSVDLTDMNYPFSRMHFDIAEINNPFREECQHKRDYVSGFLQRTKLRKCYILWLLLYEDAWKLKQNYYTIFNEKVVNRINSMKNIRVSWFRRYGKRSFSLFIFKMINCKTRDNAHEQTLKWTSINKHSTQTSNIISCK